MEYLQEILKQHQGHQGHQERQGGEGAAEGGGASGQSERVLKDSQFVDRSAERMRAKGREVCVLAVRALFMFI